MVVLPRNIQLGKVGTILTLCDPATFQLHLSQHLRALRGLHRDLLHPLDDWAQLKAVSRPSTNPFLRQEDHTLLFSPENVAASGGGGRTRGRQVPVLGAALPGAAVGNKSELA